MMALVLLRCAPSLVVPVWINYVNIFTVALDLIANFVGLNLGMVLATGSNTATFLASGGAGPTIGV